MGPAGKNKPWWQGKDRLAPVAASSGAVGNTLPGGGRSDEYVSTPYTPEPWRVSHPGHLFSRELRFWRSSKLCIIVITFIENLLNMHFKLPCFLISTLWAAKPSSYDSSILIITMYRTSCNTERARDPLEGGRRGCFHPQRMAQGIMFGGCLSSAASCCSQCTCF